MKKIRDAVKTHPRESVVVLCTFILLVIFVVQFFRGDGAQILSDIVVGIIVSLFVGLIFFLLSLLTIPDEKTCPNQCQKLFDLGIIEVRNIDTLTEKYWLDILKDVGKEDFYMMGRSLNDWVKPPYLVHLEAAFRRVLLGGKSAKIVLNSHSRAENNQRFERKLQETRETLCRIFNEISSSLGKGNAPLNGRIVFVQIDDNRSVPYMYIKNDIYSYVSVYYANALEGKHAILVKYKNGEGRMAEMYKTDFTELLDEIDKNTIFSSDGKA